MTLVPRVLELLHGQGVHDVVVTVGGTIPNGDIAQLRALGVHGVFTSGTATEDIVSFLTDALRD